MDHLELYMNDLKTVQSHNYDKFYLVHTLSMDKSELVVDAKSKVEAYI